MADQMEPRDAQPVEALAHRAGSDAGMAAHGPVARVAMARQVEGDGSARRVGPVLQTFPGEPVAGEAVQKDDRRPRIGRVAGFAPGQDRIGHGAVRSVRRGRRGRCPARPPARCGAGGAAGVCRTVSSTPRR
jgi:hypothetical protein